MPRPGRNPEPGAPRRSLGQNFLVDSRIAGRIVDAFAPRATDFVLEIGPGRGALTDRFLGRVAAVALVEKDRALAAALRERYAAHSGVTVIAGDALVCDFHEIAVRLAVPAAARLRVIGNLPYNVATPLVRRIVESGSVISDATIMVQREVAERILAPPGGRPYGYLSVIASLHARARRVLDVGPAAFRPRPKVRSSVLSLEMDPGDPFDPGLRRPLEAILSAAFSRRRKTLANAIAGGTVPGDTRRASKERAARLLAAAGLDPSARPETVPPAGWLRLADIVRNAPDALI